MILSLRINSIRILSLFSLSSTPSEISFKVGYLENILKRVKRFYKYFWSNSIKYWNQLPAEVKVTQVLVRRCGHFGSYQIVLLLFLLVVLVVPAVKPLEIKLLLILQLLLLMTVVSASLVVKTSGMRLVRKQGTVQVNRRLGCLEKTKCWFHLLVTSALKKNGWTAKIVLETNMKATNWITWACSFLVVLVVNAD